LGLSHYAAPHDTYDILYAMYLRMFIILCHATIGLVLKDEFMEVGKKLDFEDGALIVEAFRVADTSGSGKLDMEEFVFAYETMYNGDLESSAEENETFVRALRYGIDKSCSPAKYVMQMYTGTMSELNKMSDLLSEKETDYKGALETIVAMMVEDSRGNEEHGSNILWWVDICVEKVLPNVVASVVQNFGLPTDIDSCFFNEILNDDRETRVRMGSGGISKPAVKAVNDDEPLDTKSLSFFVQSMYISNVPIVHESGWWVEWLWPKLLQDFPRYLYSRLSQFLSYSGEKDFSLCRAIQHADSSSKVYKL
jgi:Ca2+-binding EF-hand superfamily protein